MVDIKIIIVSKIQDIYHQYLVKNWQDKLKKHDIYLTASLYEPGGIHQLEGMAVGLPVLYRNNSGGIQESHFRLRRIL